MPIADDSRAEQRQGDCASGCNRSIERQAGVLDSHRQNKLLIGLLALFVVAQILVLEYRWLVKPIVRMAAVLQTGEASWRELAAYAPAARRDRRIRAGAHPPFPARAAPAGAGEPAAGRNVRAACAAGKLSAAKACRFRRASRKSCSGWKVTPAACRRRPDNLVSISSEADARAGGVGAVDPAGVRPCRRGRLLDPRYCGNPDRSGGRCRADLGSGGGGAQSGGRGKERRQCADRGGAHDRAGHRPDRGCRQSDQPAGAERHHRGGARGRNGARVRRRRP